MVRLKLDIDTSFGIHNYSFQFHNGSIKTDGGEWFIGVKGKFQFHNGSIKTPFDHKKKRCEF